MPRSRVPERAFVALGANLGARERTLERALAALAELPGTRVVARSTWHETDAVTEGAATDAPPQPRYLNGVVELATSLAPHALLDELLRIEREHGRDRAREGRHGARTLDLDLLLHGEARLASPALTLPHPRLEERRFVLAPLCELAPELVLPSGRSVRARLAELAGGSPARARRAER